MTTDEKLAAILAAVQTDPGNRGLARDPHDNLFTATAGDFASACWSIASQTAPALHVVTGFLIPSTEPPMFETDGPLGAVFLVRSLIELGIPVLCSTDAKCCPAMAAGLRTADLVPDKSLHGITEASELHTPWLGDHATHLIALERPGPASNGRYHTMRGRDITDTMIPAHTLFVRPKSVTIGIGDGGNEIGMGKVPHETIVKNIPNGDLIHCRTATEHLVVAGVSNWGAYALAGGVFAIRQVTPPGWPFDPDQEQRILEVMVKEGQLVDGVTGKQTATVDGLTWPEYAAPLIRIREILES